jgi:hypothetical protein
MLRLGGGRAAGRRSAVRLLARAAAVSQAASVTAGCARAPPPPPPRSESAAGPARPARPSQVAASLTRVSRSDSDRPPATRRRIMPPAAGPAPPAGHVSHGACDRLGLDARAVGVRRAIRVRIGGTVQLESGYGRAYFALAGSDASLSEILIPIFQVSSCMFCIL